MANFSDFHLDSSILEGLLKHKLQTTRPVQEAVLPAALNHQDIFITAPTGSGKTLAFLLPVIQHCLDSKNKDTVKSIILAPTRELVEQIDRVFRDLTEHTTLRSVRISRATKLSSLNKLIATLPDVVIATPGKLLTMMAEDTIDISQVQQIILDEADRLFDIGNRDEVQGILAYIHPQRQLILCSATLNDERVLHFAETWLNNPEYVELSVDREIPENIDFICYRADDRDHKLALLTHIAKQNTGKILVFVAHKTLADALARNLRANSISAQSLHGDQDIKERKKKLLDFRNNEINVLIATDVASRGLDISDITHVVNWDIPKQGDVFLHRAGRTGRNIERGLVITLFENTNYNQKQKIERYLQHDLATDTIDGLEPKTQQHINKKKKKNRTTDNKPTKNKKKKRLRDQKDKGKPKWAGNKPLKSKNKNVWN